MSRYTKSKKKDIEEKEEEPSEELELEDFDEDQEEPEQEEEKEEEEKEEEEKLSGLKLKTKSITQQPKGTPVKTKKTKSKSQKQVTIKEVPVVKKGIYPFDRDFLKYYSVLLQMLKDRHYNFDRPNLGYVPGIEERKNSKKVNVNVIPTTAILLEKEFGGLENFKLVLNHEDDEELNVLIYYLPPEVEAKSAAAPRKQIAADQIRKALEIYENSNYPRLIILARTKLATQAADLIETANNQVINNKPKRLIQFFNMEVDLAFNYMKSRYQPKVIKILRTEDEQNEYLSQLVIDDQQTDKRRALPIVLNVDAISSWYGLKINDMILFKRVNSPAVTFSLRVTREPEELI